MSVTPRFLYFDLGNVLFFFSHARVCRQVSAVSGVPASDIGIFIEQSDYLVLLETGAVTIRDVYEEFCQSFDVSPPLADIEVAVSDIFELNESILPLLIKLVMANRRIGILSNTSHSHWEFLLKRYRMLNEFFATSALSFELKSMKPDKQIYLAAAELAGVEPQQIFFTDDRQENVKAAVAAGWQAVLYQDAQQLGEDLRRRGVAFN